MSNITIPSREKLAEHIASSSLHNSNFSNIQDYQQVLVDGLVTTSSAAGQAVVLYKSDLLSLSGIDAHDFEQIVNNFETISSSFQDPAFSYDSMETGSLAQPPNVSQFVGFQTETTVIDAGKIGEVLSADITELLPTIPIRQERVDSFFRELVNLRPEQLPPYCDDINSGLPAGTYTLDMDGQCTGTTYAEWLSNFNISTIQDAGGDDSDASITRLDEESNNNNSEKTLETIRNDLNDYLRDIDNPPFDQVIDDRPEYNHVSSGYLEIRNLNQSIIVRSGEGGEVGIDESVLLELSVPIPELDGITPGTMWDNLGYTGDPANFIGEEFPLYLYNGFTITKWVKFLDKVNDGTLFNFGNPTRTHDPFGFRLETFTVSENDVTSPGSLHDGTVPFSDNNYERFLNLVVREFDGSLRDSNFGYTGYNKYDTKTNGVTAIDASIDNAFNYTRVPIDFDEWYFIVASFSPLNNEDDTPGFVADHFQNYDYWNGNILDDSDNAYVHHSGLGNKCKVEIISKTDLLRARGYKPIEE